MASLNPFWPCQNLHSAMKTFRSAGADQDIGLAGRR